MRFYHGGTSVRPFGMSIEQIEVNVTEYIKKHKDEWAAGQQKPDCEYCKGPCQTVTACRQRRDRARQAAEMAKRAAAEGKKK